MALVQLAVLVTPVLFSSPQKWERWLAHHFYAAGLVSCSFVSGRIYSVQPAETCYMERYKGIAGSLLRSCIYRIHAMSWNVQIM